MGFDTIKLLGVMFVVLKLANVISWSWWLVLMPFYGIWALIAILFILSVIF